MKYYLFGLTLLISMSGFAGGHGLVEGFYIADNSDSPIHMISIKKDGRGTKIFILENNNVCTGERTLELSGGGTTTSQAPKSLSVKNVLFEINNELVCEKHIKVFPEDNEQISMIVDDRTRWIYGIGDVTYTFSRVSEEEYLNEALSVIESGELIIDTGSSKSITDMNTKVNNICEGHFSADCKDLPAWLEMYTEGSNDEMVYSIGIKQ
ncbi:MAG: hypothetical protein QF441_15010 [Bacteriovoracaceae bacterium]|jgi:hypothetical protein|nr:hypothetical protein [Halobacteriovoraceae bacterium]MDP7321915.1 hypothetical protein [Bacteriovoracaceae bacterium]